MLEYENVTCKYAMDEVILQNISFHIAKGEKTGLVGANGTGKSTLMKSLLGLVQYDGTITVNGIKVEKKNLAEVRKTVGYVLQNSDNQMFMPTVYEDLVFGPMNYGMSREDADRVAEKALEALGAGYLKDRYNHKLSGGEKKMAALAVILAMQPELMLLDEPSAALDPHNRRVLIDIINGLDETMLIASHDLDFILDTCDRVILLNNGGITADGDACEILSNRKLMEDNNLELPLCLSEYRGRKKNEEILTQ